MAKDVDYERLGRDFEDLVVKNYAEMYNLPRQMWLSFVKGIFAGLGGVIGATVVVGIIVWVLHRLGGLPVLGHYIEGVQTQLQSGR